GSTALEGNPTQWVADHRRHHAFSDREGDPHSPWRFGESFWGLTKGLFYAHVGWLFHRELSNRERFAPDLMADRDIRRVDNLFVPIVIASVGLPALIAGLVTWSWAGALSAFFWAGLVRIALLHHVTWSINSICHVYGERPFETRDGDPACARHGVDRGQIDMNARLIWIFEKFGWVSDVRWPKRDRLDSKRLASPAKMG